MLTLAPTLAPTPTLHQVGVEVNSASVALLQRLAGLNKRSAAALRAHIDENGELPSR